MEDLSFKVILKNYTRENSLTRLIVSVFETEVADIYNEAILKKNSRGKLVSAYKKIRSDLISCGLVEPQRKMNKEDCSLKIYIEGEIF